MALHILGLIDDRKALGPYVKLIVQLAAAAALVIPFRDVRILTTLGTVPSVVLAILWIVAITNAFNFLDNMDGLSAGVAAVCTTAFLITAISIEQWFVAATLALLLGALLGFLFFNFPPGEDFHGRQRVARHRLRPRRAHGSHDISCARRGFWPRVVCRLRARDRAGVAVV